MRYIEYAQVLINEVNQHVRTLTLHKLYRIYVTMNINISIMASAAGQASDLMKSLSNPHRLLIVCQLLDGERSVNDLAEFLGIRGTTVSQHLALLRKDGIVIPRRDGQTIWYSIGSDAARKILETLYVLYCPKSEKTGDAPD